jgi:hypothetical protein
VVLLPSSQAAIRPTVAIAPCSFDIATLAYFRKQLFSVLVPLIPALPQFFSEGFCHSGPWRHLSL